MLSYMYVPVLEVPVLYYCIIIGVQLLSELCLSVIKSALKSRTAHGLKPEQLYSRLPEFVPPTLKHIIVANSSHRDHVYSYNASTPP